MIANPIQGRRQVKNVGWAVDTHSERGSLAYNVGLRRSPSRVLEQRSCTSEGRGRGLRHI